MKTCWELTIYKDGLAILTDPAGRTAWTSDADDDFAEDFPELLEFEDGDDIAEYLIDAGILDADDPLDIVETDDTGLHVVLQARDDDTDEDEDEETLQ